MALVTRVTGGTRAGWRTLKAKANDWVCPGCSAQNKYFWLRCPACAHPRPEED